MTLSQVYALPSWEVTAWQAYYQVTDWISQGLGPERSFARGLAFAREVQRLDEEAHEKNT